jgi:hypothetical protein
MGDYPSINNTGLVIFVGQTPTGENLFVGDGTATPNPISLLSSPRRFFGRAAQLNDLGIAIGSDHLTGSPPLYFERLFNVSQGVETVIAQGGPSYEFDAVLGEASININNDVVFSALSGSNLLLVSRQANGTENQIQLPANSLPRPMIADNQSIVVRVGNLPASPILLLDINLLSSSSIAGGSSYASTGNQPGISRNGRVVTFYGDLSQAAASQLGLPAGPGIFASIDSGNGSRNVISLTAGQKFSSFDTDSRIGVTDEDVISKNLETDTFVACFIATRAGKRGIWTVRVDASGPANGALQQNVGAPSSVVNVGDTIDGMQIQNVAVYDPITADAKGALGSHHIVFWAQTSQGDAIIRAEPKVATTIFFSNGVLTDLVRAHAGLVALQSLVLSGPGITNKQTAPAFELAFDSGGSAFFALFQIFQALPQIISQDVSNFFRFLANYSLAPSTFLTGTANLIDSGAVIAQPDLQLQIQGYTDALNSSGNVIVVAHSQGNLYANAAYAALFLNPNPLNGRSADFEILSVASPATFVAGGETSPISHEHVTLFGDAINSVVGSLPANFANVTPINCSASASVLEPGLAVDCHDFAKSYLPGNSTGSAIQSEVGAAVR